MPSLREKSRAIHLRDGGKMQKVMGAAFRLAFGEGSEELQLEKDCKIGKAGPARAVPCDRASFSFSVTL